MRPSALWPFNVLQLVYNCLPGCLPNIARNSIVNCSELVTYDIIKELLLKRHLMTGEPAKRFTFIPWNFTRVTVPPCCGTVTCQRRLSQNVFPSNRQHALSPHRGLRRRLLHHHGGVSGGRGEDALHELGAGPVQQLCQLRLDHAG